MLSFETKVWFTTTLPETLAFTAATTNLSFSPHVCHSPPLFCRSISPSFFSIAPHYFAHSLSPPTPLWCFCPSLSLLAEWWLSKVRHAFKVWWPIFHSVEECLCVYMRMHVCVCLYFLVGVTQGFGSRQGRQEGERKQGRHFLRKREREKERVSMAGCVEWLLGQRIWLDPELIAPASSITWL